MSNMEPQKLKYIIPFLGGNYMKIEEIEIDKGGISLESGLEDRVLKNEAIDKSFEPREKKDYSVNRYAPIYVSEISGNQYGGRFKDYMAEHLSRMNDFASRVLFTKHLNIMPSSWMGGVLGFTYLGENFMARRDDLSGRMAQMVDLHEAIHTPDEYETRILTSWIMSKEMPKYIK